MDAVAYMTDFLPVRMLGLAQKAERRFERCLMACPREGDTIKIDDPEIFGELLDHRIESLVLSMTAFEAYLGFLAHRNAQALQEAGQDLKLADHFEAHHFDDIFKTFPNRFKRRHEQVVEENADKPVSHFLTQSDLSLEQKLIYWTLIRTGKLVSFKEGYVKKFMRVLSTYQELLHQDFEIAPELKKVSTLGEINRVFLHQDLPEGITPGVSSSDECVVESYEAGHFMWELLHCYPARMAQEIIAHLHKIDGSENHFIIALCASDLVDEKGEPVTEPAPRYALEVNLGG